MHGGEPCPGAPWQGLPYERQLAHKSEQVDEALRRIGDLDGFELEPIVAGRASSGATATSSSTPSARTRTASRSSASTPAAAGTWSSTSRTASSPPRPATPPATRSATGRGWSRSPPSTAAPARGVLRNLVVREGRRTRPDPDPPRHRRSRASRSRPVDLHTIVDDDSGGTDGPTGVLGEEHLREELCGLKLEISHGAFFQTNTEMAERLYAVAAEYAGLSGSERRLRPLLRDRHDRADDGRRRPARSGGWRSSPRRSPTPSATPS